MGGKLKLKCSHQPQSRKRRRSAKRSTAFARSPGRTWCVSEIGKDWSDEWAIFFRIVVTDDAAKNRLSDIRTKIVRGLARELDFPVLGVYPYHNFRSESEQALLREPAWA